MGHTRPQTWHIVNQKGLNALETKSRESLANLNDILDSKLDYPFRISLSGSTVTIHGSEVQMIQSDDSSTYADPKNSFKTAPSPIQGRYKVISQTTLNLSGGSQTGDFAPGQIATAPVMTSGNYVWMAIELRTNGKFYIVWGEQNAVANDATTPIFKSGDAIFMVLLQDNGSGGSWNFNVPTPEDVIVFKESNALEIREDAVLPVRVVDLVTTALPSGASVTLDGTSIVEDDLVLFTQSPIEGVYRATGIGSSVEWEKILEPENGANVQCTDGTTYLRTIWKRIQNIWRPIEVADAVKEPSGFPNRTDSTFSFDDVTRTFSIEPSPSGAGFFDFFEKGKIYRRTSTDSVVIPDTEGGWFFYYQDGVLTAEQTFEESIILEKAYISNTYWDATNNEHIILGDERHGITMDGATHKYLHLSVGTVIQSGISIGSYTVSGSGNLDTDAQLSLSNGRLFDEDIDIHINHSNSPTEFFEQDLGQSDGAAKLPVYYRTGTGEYRKDTSTSFPLKQGTTTIQWNKLDGGTWTTEETASGFVTSWVFATNSVTEPVVVILGQNEYDNLTLAQEQEQFSSLNLGNFPVAEFKLCYRLIWESQAGYTNTPSARLADIQDLRVAPDAPFPSVSPNDHGLLSGLSDPDHPPTAVTTAGVVKDGGLSASDVDAENVFDTLNKVLGQLRLKEHPSNKKRVILTGAQRILNNNTELGQALGLLLLKFEGAEIDFSTGNIYESDGMTSLGIDFTPEVIPANQWQWYSVNVVPNAVSAENEITAQVLVVPATGTGATKDSAPRAPFATGQKIGQVAVQESGGNINDIAQANVIQLGIGTGGGGNGTGDANELLERLKNRLDLSTFEYVTPNIFSTTGEDLSDIGNTTASFSVVEQAYEFENIGDKFQSINNLDSDYLTEIDAPLTDITNVELIAYYDINNVDDSATYQVSRDGGNFWQTVTLDRIGSSDTFRGLHTFVNEAGFGFVQTIGGSVISSTDLTDVNTLNRQFTLANATTIKTVGVNITVVGSPTGKLRCRIVNDDGFGSPSTDPSDIRFEAPLYTIDGAISGGIALNFTTPLPAGDYHVVFDTDTEYKSNYNVSAGANRISIDDDGTNIVYTLNGRELDLRVRVTGGTPGSIFRGYGLFYRLESAVNTVAGLYNEQKFVFDGVVDNFNEFTLNFLPDKNLLRIYEIATGQVYRYGAFSLDGTKVVFPPNTFNKAETITLVFDQIQGSSFDNSDRNGLLLATNHLGSTDGTIDASLNGRGIFLRRPDGTLREIAIDNSDNIVIFSV